MRVGFAPPPGAPTIETSVLIAAPIAEIWRVLTAFNSYGDWNSQLLRIDGIAVVGSRLVLNPVGEPPKSVTVEELAPYRMRWVGGADDLADFKGDHFFELEPVAANATLFLHREFFTGRLVLPILAAYRDAIHLNFEAFNSCLQAVVERRAGG